MFAMEVMNAVPGSCVTPLALLECLTMAPLMSAELSVPERRRVRSVPAVAEASSATGRWLAAGRLDSHLGGARTLILPGRIGPATRESA